MCTCRAKHAILIRPKHFRSHEPHFLLTWQPRFGTAAEQGLVAYDCRRIPLHLQRWHWTVLLPGGSKRGSLTDQLVLHDSQITRVLSKFERRQFIHCFVEADQPRDGDGDTAMHQEPVREMLFELPRFGLQFELRGGELWSLDFAGRCLAPMQQLLVAPAADSSAFYQLPDFSQYLVLLQATQQGGAQAAGNQQGTALQLVVPVGRVRRLDAAVMVAHGQGSHDKLQVMPTVVCLGSISSLG